MMLPLHSGETCGQTNIFAQILNASDSILKQTDQYVCAHLYVAGNYAQQKSQVSKNVQKLISTRKNDQYSNVNCSAG